MKTISEIKKGLECCALPSGEMRCLQACPYHSEHDARCIERMCADARELIQRLEAINGDFDEYARQY